MGQKIISGGRKLAITIIAASAALLGSAGTALAETETAGAEAAVVTPLTLVKRDDLHMGQILPGASAGNVTLSVNGNRTSTGGVTLVGSNEQLARFAGQGSFFQFVQVQLPNTTTLTGPGAPMQIDNFQFGPDATLPGTYFRFGNSSIILLTSGSGAFGFVVGGRLGVGANQAGGTYSGSFDVTANYF